MKNPKIEIRKVSTHYIKLYITEKDVLDCYKFKVELQLQKAIDDCDRTEWKVSVGGYGLLSTKDSEELNFLLTEGIKVDKELNKNFTP